MVQLMEHPSLNPPESAPAGHELRDVQPGPILIFAVTFLAALALVYLVGWGVLNRLERIHSADNRLAFPSHPLFKAMRSIPPDPRLEPEPSHDVPPRADLIEVRAREEALIGDHAWGWADSSHQFARIPVQSAIDLVVQRGLPAVLPATQPSDGPFMPPASALHGPGGVP